MRRDRKYYLFTIVAVSVIGFTGAYSFFCSDECFFAKPLSAGIPLKIRVDSCGNGHFGSSREENRRHNGIDLEAPLNSPVLAAKSGIVIKTGVARRAGNYIIIWHWPNLKSYYLHLSQISVKRWQPVKQGQIIGNVGKTGNADHENMKPHLHFEIRENNLPQDILKKWSIGSLMFNRASQKSFSP